MPGPIKLRKRMKYPVDLDSDMPLSEAPDDGSISTDSGDEGVAVTAATWRQDEEEAHEVSDIAPATPPLNLASTCTSNPVIDESVHASNRELGSSHVDLGKVLTSSRCCAWHLFSGTGVTDDQFAVCAKEVGISIADVGICDGLAFNILDTSSWDALTSSLRPGIIDLIIMTPPAFTFLANTGDGNRYRGALKAERDGIGKTQRRSQTTTQV